MRVRLMILTVVLLAVSTMTATAQDQGLDFGLRTGYYVGTDGPFVGLEVAFPFLPLFYFNPNIEAAFGNHRDTFSMNADAYLEIPIPEPTRVWFGGGPAVLIRNNSLPPPHHNSDDVNLGLNAFTGVGWRTGSGPMFYFQGKVVLTSDVEGVFGFGIRF